RRAPCAPSTPRKPPLKRCLSRSPACVRRNRRSVREHLSMIHLRPTLAIARKDAQDVIVDKSKLFSVLAPVVLSMFYLLVSGLTDNHPPMLLVYNPGQSRLEQVVVGAFATPRITHANAPDEVSAAFGPDGTQKDSTYDAGLIIPPDFEQRLQA